MRKDWLEAAQMYVQFKKGFGIEATHVPEIVAMARALQLFLRSEDGMLGCLILELTEKEILIGSRPGVDRNDPGEKYSLSYRGYIKLAKPDFAGSFPLPPELLAKMPPMPSPTTTFEVAASAHLAGRTADDLVPWIITEIHKIASAHPRLPQ